ncbi:MAG: ATP-dependent helicase [Hyphomicrobium sp.]|nr:MAG: ATP-dependent helicase [Hyphomicrobium sp.]MBZ0211198.1 ATP-dependent helicase [Hyphomicrobium sp.]
MLQPRRIAPNAWTPIGVDALEANALDVVRSTDNRSVIAGPGAGKTELLAQRAAYLLQTGGSPQPQRILAICFKRDAATNLAARVRSRCRPEHAARLDSLTFDAFAKSIVDRFGQALPQPWRPTADYQIFFTNPRAYDDFLRTLGNPPAVLGTRDEIETITSVDFERLHLFGAPLPEEPQPPQTVPQWAAARWWKASLRGPKGSFLSFPMIGRLAELSLRVNPMARQALALTYSHLFLDEFQDTTQIQYDLVKTVFLKTSTVVTAVGDNKQQIMRWAMAMDKPFLAMEHDFGAKRTPLLSNYRSSPDLVRIQHVLAKALDDRSVKPVSKTKVSVSGDCCAVWDFSSPDAEAKTLAEFIQAQMEEHGLGPRDFVLLVRQKAASYVPLLSAALADHGITLRNEAAEIGAVRLQELLSEELSGSVIGFVRVASTDRAGQAWADCLSALGSLRGLPQTDERANLRLEREVETFAAEFRNKYPAPVTTSVKAAALVSDVLDFIGRSQLIAASPAYRQGDWMEKVSKAVARHLFESCVGQSDWLTALDVYEGAQSLPLMTIHKSKGLEYHTVIFVGLDDGAWWSFADDHVEATAGFFVAFTRAKQRVLFTYCPKRGARETISALYELLRMAGVPIIDAG